MTPFEIRIFSRIKAMSNDTNVLVIARTLVDEFSISFGQAKDYIIAYALAQSFGDLVTDALTRNKKDITATYIGMNI